MDYASQGGMAHIKRKSLSALSRKKSMRYDYDKSSVANVNLGFKQFAILTSFSGGIATHCDCCSHDQRYHSSCSLYSKRFTIETIQLVGATTMYIPQAIFRSGALFRACCQRSLAWRYCSPFSMESTTCLKPFRLPIPSKAS